MAVSHVFSDAIANWTGTVTVFDSAGNTGTVAATNLVRPQDWNSAHNQFYTLTGNTTGNSTASGTNIIIAGSGGISVGGSTGTVVISGQAPVTHNGLDPFNFAPLTQGSFQGSLFVKPMTLPNVAFDRVGFRISHSNTSNSSGSWTITQLLGIYTKNASTLSLLSSTSFTGAITNSGTVGIYSSVGGHRLITVGLTGTLTEGDYWCAVGFSTASGGADCTVRALMLQQNPIGSAAFATFSGLFSVASNSTIQAALGQGVYSAVTAALPNSIAFTQINGTLFAHTGAGFMQAFMFGSGTV